MGALPKIGSERVYRDVIDVLYPGEVAECTAIVELSTGELSWTYVVRPEPGWRARLRRLNFRLVMSSWTYRVLQGGCLFFIGLNLVMTVRPGASWPLRLVSLAGVLAPIWALAWPRFRRRRRARRAEQRLRRELGIL